MIYLRLIYILLLCLCSCNLAAANSGSFGDVAVKIYEPISLVIQLVKAVSVISGSGLLLGGVLKYIDYRRNPVAVRLGTVMFMFIFGGALILVGLIPFKFF